VSDPCNFTPSSDTDDGVEFISSPPSKGMPTLQSGAPVMKQSLPIEGGAEPGIPSASLETVARLSRASCS
jgi:hypothetical protein